MTHPRHCTCPAPRIRPASSVLLLCLLLAAWCAPAGAATYIVSSSNDSGPGTLRQAMLTAAAAGGTHSIVFDAATNGNAIVLNSSLPPLTNNLDLSINGNGPDNTIIDGNGLHQPISSQFVTNRHLTLRDLTIRNGRAEGSNGGAVEFLGGTASSLTVERVEFVNNFATWEGGAIRTSVPTHIEGSLFVGNHANSFGAAISAVQTPLTLHNSTFTGNYSTLAVIQLEGDVSPELNGRLVNITVTGNNTYYYTIRANSNARLSMSNSLVAGNTVEEGGSLHFTNGSQIDAATSFNNILGPADEPGLVDGVNGNQLDVLDPLVGPLGDYGGPTRTLPLLPGSPAIDAGTGSGGDIPATDQRGLGRVGAVDVGAFESRGFTLARVAGDAQSAIAGTPFGEPLVVQVGANDASEPVTGGQVLFTAPPTGPSAVLVPAAASIGSDGQAQTAATANTEAGGPYTVSARIPGPPAVAFSLTNDPHPCSAFAFPYTLTGADNAARVAELRQAVQCANGNGNDPQVDGIDLAGHVLVFSDAWEDGDNALPPVTAPLALRNGALQRDEAAPAFRLLASAPGGALHLEQLQLRGGLVGGDGGAILALGELQLHDSVLEGNRAGQAGGALASQADATIAGSRFSDNSAGSEGAALASQGTALILNSRFQDHIDDSSHSLLWSNNYLAMVGSLVAGNELAAAGSSLFAFTPDTVVVEMRLVTIADNHVQGWLFDRPQGASTLYNSIVWDNTASAPGMIDGRFNILQDHLEGNDNRSLPPGFVGGGDYRLDAGSPAIDAGDSVFAMLDFLDLDGDGITDELIPDLDLNPRGVDDPGVADTSAGSYPYLDLGAFERQQPSPPAGVHVSHAGDLVTGENGDTASFTVVLDRYPTAPVTLAVASSDPGEGLPSPPQLVFNASNWNQPRTVTVIGIDDDEVDGDQAYFIHLGPALSDDPDYHGLAPPPVPVTNLDDDVPALRQIGGTVVGLAGSGLALALDIGDGPLPITGNGPFQFPGSYPAGSPWTVTVATQPQDPAQACQVLNGSGTLGEVDVHSVVVNCGAGAGLPLGGTVSGLDGTVVLQLNGGAPLPLSASGPYVFPQTLAPGASYVVSIAQQPPGQQCSLANASGVVAGSGVDDIDVDCSVLYSQLHASLDDNGDYARYGRIRDYLVQVGNSGNAPAAVQLDGQFSAAFDQAHVQWLCVDSGGGSCPASGSGGFATSATIPAGATASWIVSAPVRMDSADAQATVDLEVSSADATAQASDSNQLVLLRDGFNRPYGDGANAGPPAAQPLSAADSLVLEVPAAAAPGSLSLARLQLAHGQVEVQLLTLEGNRYVRLLAQGTAQGERGSGFVPVQAGQRLALGLVETTDGDVVLLEGTAQPLAVTLASPTGEIAEGESP